MRLFGRIVSFGAVLLWTAPGMCSAETTSAAPAGARLSVPALRLTLKELEQRVAARSPAAVLGAMRSRETAAKRVGATVLLRQNPTLAGAVGARLDDTGADTIVVGSVELEQRFDLGGGRSSRIAAADAALAESIARNENSTRLVRRAASIAFARCIWARESLELLGEMAKLAHASADATHRQAEQGQASAIAVNTADAELARIDAQAAAMRAEQAGAEGELRSLLGIEAGTTIEPDGHLLDLLDVPALGHRSLAARAERRADLRALDDEARSADAEQRAARALAWPEVGFGVRYEHGEPGAHSILGTASLTLPFFERNQGPIAEARARGDRARKERSVLTSTATVEAETAAEVLARRMDAVRTLEKSGAGHFEENVALGEKAFAAGEISRFEQLLLRRELAAFERERLDRELDAAIARFDLEAALGDAR